MIFWQVIIVFWQDDMVSDLYVNHLENNFELSEKYVVNFDSSDKWNKRKRERKS